MEKSMYIGSGPAQQVPMEHAYEAFRLRCRSQNLSPETCTWYKYRLGLFSRFLESKEISDAREITPHFIRLYLDHLRVKGTCSGTVARDYGALKCFFRFLTRERLIPENPISLVEKPRMEKKLIKPLSMDQARLLLSKSNHKTFLGQRIWTIAVLMLDTGMRRGEVIGLKKDEIDFQRGVLRVMGRGAKEREVPFGTTAKQALWNYLIRRGEFRGKTWSSSAGTDCGYARAATPPPAQARCGAIAKSSAAASVILVKIPTRIPMGYTQIPPKKGLLCLCAFLSAGSFAYLANAALIASSNWEKTSTP